MTGRTAIALGVALLVAFLVSGCTLRREVPRPVNYLTIKEWVCPNETVTLRWDYQNGAQPGSCSGIHPRTIPHSRCRTVALTSYPTHASMRAAFPTELVSERDLIIDQNYVFSLQAYEAQPPGDLRPAFDPPLQANVYVFDASRGDSIDFDFQAGCSSEGSLVYTGPHMNNKLSPCMYVERICNRSDRAIRVARGISRYRRERVLQAMGQPGDCTSDFGSVPVVLYVQPPVATSCTSLPPDVRLRFQVTCVRPSESPECRLGR